MSDLKVTFNSTPSDEIILFSAMILGEILNLGMIDMTGWIDAEHCPSSMSRTFLTSPFHCFKRTQR